MIYQMALSFEEQQQVETLISQFDAGRQRALAFLFEGLNREQMTALSHPISAGNPLLILAGAGSGKTAVLTRRVALLLLAGVPSERLFVSTFTVKAAGEMKERIGKLIADMSGKVPGELHAPLADMMRGISLSWIGTFHSLCLRLLRERRPDGFTPLEELGYPPQVLVLSDSESWDMIKSIVESLQVKPDLRDIAAAMDLAANELLTPAALGANKTYAGVPTDVLAEVWMRYTEAKKTRGVVDFTDLLYLTATALVENRVSAEGWKNRFTHTLIDEYQDTNVAQYAIATELAAAKKNLFVVGDDDQSIYGFRGADVRNIRKFTEDYPESRVVRLIRNYRSTPTILAAANAVLLDKTDGMDKTLLAAANYTRPPEKIAVYEAMDETDEMNFVVFQIREILKEGFEYRDIVIFYRVHQLSEPAAAALRSQNIPLLEISGRTISQSAAVKSFRAALTAVQILHARREGRFDTVQHSFFLQDALKEIWKLGTFGPKNREDRDMLLSLPAPERILLDEQAFVEAIQNCKSGQTQQHLERLWTALHGGAQSLGALTPFQLVQLLTDTLGLNEMMAENSDVRGEVILLNRFLAARLPYAPAGADGLEMLLSAFQSSDRGEPVADLLQENAVRLLTIHAAKGLEFPVVFVIGVEEDILPFVHPSETKKETADEKWAREAEELRLFYVAITRAKQVLILTSAARRKWFGRETSHRPSRFLARLPHDLVTRGTALSPVDRVFHRSGRFFKDLFSA